MVNKVINVTRRIWIVVNWNYFYSTDYDLLGEGTLLYGVRLCIYGWIIEFNVERIVGYEN